MRKKDILARACHVTGAFAFWRALGADRLRVLAYHRVVPGAEDATWPFDVELISATPEDFRWQMEHVARHFRPVTLTEVVDAIAGGRELPRRAMLVTFDDGFSDNHDYALPVLREVGVPACVFIATDLIGTEHRFWFESVARVVMAAPPGVRLAPAAGFELVVADRPEARRAQIAGLLGRLKRVPEESRDAVVQALAAQCPPPAERAVESLSRSMTWDQVRAMYRAGIEFGAHGASHAVLAQLRPDALDAELVRARAAIERELGAAPRALAYPVGGPDAYTPEVIAAARRAGYVAGFSYIQGDNPRTGADAFNLRRQHVERSTRRAYFAGLSAWPAMFS